MSESNRTFGDITKELLKEHSEEAALASLRLELAKEEVNVDENDSRFGIPALLWACSKLRLPFIEALLERADPNVRITRNPYSPLNAIISCSSVLHHRQTLMTTNDQERCLLLILSHPRATHKESLAGWSHKPVGGGDISPSYPAGHPLLQCIKDKYYSHTIMSFFTKETGLDLDLFYNFPTDESGAVASDLSCSSSSTGYFRPLEFAIAEKNLNSFFHLHRLGARRVIDDGEGYECLDMTTYSEEQQQYHMHLKRLRISGGQMVPPDTLELAMETYEACVEPSQVGYARLFWPGLWAEMLCTVAGVDPYVVDPPYLETFNRCYTHYHDERGAYSLVVNPAHALRSTSLECVRPALLDILPEARAAIVNATCSMALFMGTAEQLPSVITRTPAIHMAYWGLDFFPKPGTASVADAISLAARERERGGADDHFDPENFDPETDYLPPLLRESLHKAERAFQRWVRRGAFVLALSSMGALPSGLNQQRVGEGKSPAIRTCSIHIIRTAIAAYL